MTIEKGYLSQKYEATISKRRVVAGLFLSVGLSVGLYSLICLLRFIGITFENNIFNNGPIQISAENRYWQNFSFALISFVIGHSIFLITVFTKPLKFKFSEIKRSGIINNQVFLGFNFYYLFFKLFLFILLVIAYEVLYYIENFYFLFYLFALVLFLESWKTILLLFKKHTYKYLFLNAFVIVTLSFLIAFTSIFDLDKLEYTLLKNNPKIELPSIHYDVFQPDHNYRGNAKPIKIYSENNHYVYVFDGKKYYDLKNIFERLYSDRDKQIHFYPNVLSIYATSKIKMTEINKIRFLAFELHNSYGVEFMANQSNLSKNELIGISKRDWFSENKIKEFLTENNLPSNRPPTPPMYDIKISENDLIAVQIKKEEYVINNNIIERDHLVKEFTKYINEQNYIHFTYSEQETTYQEFLTAYSAYRKAVIKLREAEQKVELISENFRNINEDEFDEDQKRLNAKFPIRFLENDYRRLIIKK